MDLFTRDTLRELLTINRAPCVSFFMRTTRAQQAGDETRWRNQLREAEEGLQRLGKRSTEIDELLSPARALRDDAAFWRGVSDGLAAFAAPDFFRTYRLPFPFADEVIVGDTFQVKPLLPLLNGEGAFDVLVLSRTGLRLLRCTRDTLHEVDFRSLPDAVGLAFEMGDESAPLAPGAEPRATPPRARPTFDPTGLATAGSREQRREYFHRADCGLKALRKNDPAPLVLAGSPELQEDYRKVNTSGRLIEEGVECEPDQLTLEQVRDQAYEAVQHHARAARERVAGMYRQLHGTGRTANDFAEVVRSAHQGQVQYLFVDRRRELWGRFDPATGHIERYDRQEDGAQDLANLAAAHTLLHGGTVYAVERDDMPDATPLAAVYRLPIGERSDTHVIAGSERA